MSVPLISVILPVYNGADTISGAIAALRASTRQDFELIVVDDASTDSTPALLAELQPDLHLVLPKNAGPNACRNLGARHARGQLLFFTDADVTVAPDTLERVAAHWRDHQRQCVIGLYTQDHPNPDAWSQYKNAWIRHTYLSAHGSVDWFFTAVGMVHRDVWSTYRGIDGRLENDELGDWCFGQLLSKCGVEIHLDSSLAVTHHKGFSAASLLRNQATRAASTLRAAVRRSTLASVPSRGYANVSRSFIAGTVLAPIALLLGLLAPFFPSLGWLALAALGLCLATAAPFLAHVARAYGVVTAASFAAIGILDRLACAFGLGLGTLQLLRGVRPTALQPIEYHVQDRQSARPQAAL